MYEDCREMLLTGVFFKLAKYHLLGWTTILGIRSELQAVVQRDEKPKECTKKREDPFLSFSFKEYYWNFFHWIQKTL
jgi:hypothetical protein